MPLHQEDTEHAMAKDIGAKFRIRDPDRAVSGLTEVLFCRNPMKAFQEVE